MIHVYDEILRQNFWIFYGKGVNYTCKEMSKLGININPKIFTGVGGKCIEYYDGIFIWTKEKKPSHLTHECLHAVIRHYESRDMCVDKSTEEFYCYFLQYLIRKVLG